MRLGALGEVDLSILGILLNQAAGPDDVAFTDRHALGDGRIDSDEAVVAKPAMTGNHRMAGDKTVLPNL